MRIADRFSLAVIFVIFSFYLASRVNGFSGGAPPSVCPQSLVPQHDATFQNSPSPYEIKIIPTNASNSYIIKVRSISGSTLFMGFVLQSRNHASGVNEGTFTAIANTKLICENAISSTITHNAPLNVAEISIPWTAASNSTSYDFIAIVVQTRLLFWSISSAIKVNSSFESIFNATVGPNQNSFMCVSEQLGVIWQVQGDGVNFIVLGSITSSTDYVAVALSEDNQMDDDSVTDCYQHSSGVYLGMSWNGEAKNDPISNVSASLKSQAVTYNNGILVCNFTRFSKRPEGLSSKLNSTLFYPADQPYYFLLAKGNVINGTTKKHYAKCGNNEIKPINITDTSSVHNYIARMNSVTVSTTIIPGIVNPLNGSSYSCGSSCSLTWSDGGDYVDFVLTSSISDSSHYLALGLSKDRSMGDDSVTACYGNTVEMYWNPPGKVRSVKLNNNQLGLQPFSTSVSIVNNILTCKFSRNKDSPGRSKRQAVTNDQIYYPNDQLFYLFVAFGPVAGNQITQHISLPSISNNALNLTNFQTVGSGTIIISSLIKAHGILMVISWLMCAMFAIPIARYFKKIFPSNSILGKPIWFVAHAGLNLLTLVLTSIAFIIIFSYAKDWAYTDGPAKAHAPIGVVVTILTIINPFISIFRCEPNDPYRWVFNIFHFLIGNLAQAFAIITIFLATYFDEITIPLWIRWIMVTIIGWLVFYHTINTIYDNYLAANYGEEMSNTIQMYNFKYSSDKNELLTKPEVASRFKYFLLLIHIMVCLPLAIAICVGIGQM